LLFDKIEKDTKSPEKVKQETVDDSEPSEDEKDPKMLLSNLFGDEWSDIIGKSEKPTVSSIEVVKRVRVPEPLIQNIEFVMEPLNVPQRHVEEIPIPTEEPSPESSYEDSSFSEEESVYIESESEEALVAPVFVEDPHVVQKTFEPVIYPVEAEPGNGSIPPEEAAVADITDAELSLFAELADPFPAFQDDVEEEIFDNRVRERIDVLESLGDTYEEIQQLLTAFGIPWVSAPADAEAQCAFLAASGLTDGVISDDSDTIVYGSPIVFRHLYIGDSTVEIYRTQEIGFDREELISLALLLGCDFTIGVRGIGPVNATEIVRHYKGVDQLRRFREWAERFAGDSGKESEPVIGEDPDDASLRVFKSTHANYRSQWLFTDDFPSQEVWDVFDKPLVDTNLEPFTWATPDEQLISEVVTSFTDLKQSQVDHILSSTMSQYRQASTQRRITDYFSPVFERGSVAEVVSKRLKAALAQSTSF
jgi:DNA excision repair protein ERCC-5